jgi:hypothetical protein
MDDDVVIAFMPALVALLTRAEQLKGQPLTEAEALRIRDNAICATVTPAQAQSLAEERGYDDIDPEDCWAQWQQVRASLAAENGK